MNNGYSRMGESGDSSIAVGDLISMDFTAGPPNGLPWEEEQQQRKEDIRFEVPLSGSRSSASQRFAGGASSALQAAVRRAFSMRKSSSVREGYWRIHDSTGDDEDGDCGCDEGSAEARDHGQPPPPPPEQQRQQGRRKKGGKQIRACKRLFGY